MSPLLWFLAGWLFAWLPVVFVLGLTWILDRRAQHYEDKNWWRRTEPNRDAWRQEILTTRCTHLGVPNRN